MQTAGWAICRDVCKALLQASLKASLEDLFRSCPEFAIRMACKGQRSQPNPVKPCEGCTVQFDHCSGMFRARMGYPAEPDATSNTAAPMEERLPLLPFFHSHGRSWPGKWEKYGHRRIVNQVAKTYTHNVIIDMSAHTHTRFFFGIIHYLILHDITMNVHTHSICLHVIMSVCTFIEIHIDVYYRICGPIHAPRVVYTVFMGVSSHWKSIWRIIPLSKWLVTRVLLAMG